MINLENYINDNVGMKEDDTYYNESFCNLVFEYVGMMGTFSEEDKNYLVSKGYTELDFVIE